MPLPVQSCYIHLPMPTACPSFRQDGLCRKPCRCKRRRGSSVTGKRRHVSFQPGGLPLAGKRTSLFLFALQSVFSPRMQACPLLFVSTVVTDFFITVK